MSSLERINRTAEFYSSQELWAALTYQVRFNSFSGTEVVKDLYDHSQLWSSFVFTRPVYTPDPTGLGIRNQIDLLLDMVPSHSSDRHSYVADTLYLLAVENTQAISTLLSLGQKWQTDSIEVFKQDSSQRASRLQQQLARRLKRSLYIDPSSDAFDGVVISYWWDRSSAATAEGSS